MVIVFLVMSLVCSTIMYAKLRQITHMNQHLFFIDNVIVALVAWLIGMIFVKQPIVSIIVNLAFLPILAYVGIQIRFWRTPKREVVANESQVVSPADGQIIYINRICENDDYISIKNGRLSNIRELTMSDMIKKPCWQIGINMTPFDVHKNCSPIDGTVIQSIHIPGVFHSLKDFLSMTENERHTYVIQNQSYAVGVVQIASRRVRRIDSYVREGGMIKKGDWIGMIRFGSQVDLFLPLQFDIMVTIGQQVYAKKSIVAEAH